MALGLEATGLGMTVKYAVPTALGFDGSGPLVTWRAGDGGRFGESFHEDTLRRFRRDGGAEATTPLDALAAEPAEPTALIFHVSRCGSTLVSRMLAALPDALAISEAPVLDQILRWPGLADDDQRIALLRGLMGAWRASQADPPARLYVKLDCWHLFHLPLLRRAFPRTPMLFLHRDPVEVLVSLMRQPSMTLIRGTVTAGQLGLADSARDALSREEHAAAILGALFRTAREHRGQLTELDYADLPDAALTAAPGGPFTPDEQTLMLAAAGRDAKAPEQAFVSDVADKRRAASPAILAAIARWTTPHYRRWIDG